MVGFTHSHITTVKVGWLKMRSVLYLYVTVSLWEGGKFGFQLKTRLLDSTGVGGLTHFSPGKLIRKWFSINIRVIEVRKLLTLAWMWYWCWCPIFITLTWGVKGRIERSIFELKCFSKLFTLVSTRYFDNNNNVFINFVGPEKRVIYNNSALNF